MDKMIDAINNVLNKIKDANFNVFSMITKKVNHSPGVVMFHLSILVTDPNFMSISRLVLKL